MVAGVTIAFILMSNILAADILQCMGADPDRFYGQKLLELTAHHLRLIICMLCSYGKIHMPTFPPKYLLCHLLGNQGF